MHEIDWYAVTGFPSFCYIAPTWTISHKCGLNMRISIFNICLKYMTSQEKLERAKGLVFEDAIPGVEAGKRAGMNGTPSNFVVMLVRSLICLFA